MKNRIESNPTKDTVVTIFGNFEVRIYNYCPGCRGEAAPCGIHTEICIKDKDGKSQYIPYDKLENPSKKVLDLPKIKEKLESIDHMILGAPIMEGNLYEYLNIYNIATIKNLEAINGDLTFLHEHPLVQQYKTVLEMADVPELIRDNPGFATGAPIGREDVEWAEQRILEHKKK